MRLPVKVVLFWYVGRCRCCGENILAKVPPRPAGGTWHARCPKCAEVRQLDTVTGPCATDEEAMELTDAASGDA